MYIFIKNGFPESIKNEKSPEKRYLKKELYKKYVRHIIPKALARTVRLTFDLSMWRIVGYRREGFKVGCYKKYFRIRGWYDIMPFSILYGVAIYCTYNTTGIGIGLTFIEQLKEPRDYRNDFIYNLFRILRINYKSLDEMCFEI